MTKARWILLAAVLAAGGAGWWWLTDGQQRSDVIVLYGNVDLRQADLPFNASERVTQVLVQEGDHVKAGQLMARLDPTRIQPQVATPAHSGASLKAGRKIDSEPQIDDLLVNNTIQIRYLGTTSLRDQQGGLQGVESA